MCWHESPEERPTFSSLVQEMSALLEEEAGYVDLYSTLNWKTPETSQQEELKNDIQQGEEVHLDDSAM